MCCWKQHITQPIISGQSQFQLLGKQTKNSPQTSLHFILQFSVNQFPSVVSLFAVMCFWLMTPASEAGVTKTWCRSWYLDPPSVSSRSRMQWWIFQNHIIIFSFMILKLMTYEPFNFQLVPGYNKIFNWSWKYLPTPNQIMFVLQTTENSERRVV